MADVKEFNINGTVYEVKDETARSGLSGKQDALVSGTNIKTINNQSLLGSGNISLNDIKGYQASCTALAQSAGICSWTVTHNLNSENVVTTLYNGNNKVSHNVNIVSQNVLTISFLSATNVSAGDYKIVIIAL